MSRRILCSIVVVVLIVGGSVGILWQTQQTQIQTQKHTNTQNISELLVISRVVDMSSISTVEEYSSETIDGIQIIDYNQQRNAAGHSYNFFKVTGDVSYCADVVVPKHEFFHNEAFPTSQGWLFCGRMSTRGNWETWINYPDRVFFSYANVWELKEAILKLDKLDKLDLSYW